MPNMQIEIKKIIATLGWKFEWMTDRYLTFSLNGYFKASAT